MSFVRRCLSPLVSFRINRGAFGVAFLLLALVTVGTAKIYPSFLNGGFVWPWMFLHAARLHDFNRRGLWACLVVVAILSAFVMLATLRPPNLLYGPLAILAFAALAIFTLWAGLRPGDAGNNRFGKPPTRLGMMWTLTRPV
ncbi:DUF805 domain-containing protein [Phenylobacterium sp.]|uniref:DUF805 domain-containing protein n=1 Tax=Phenylobacterium sp. TaxID=1871053 RepID=UPI0035B2B27B